MIRTIPLLAPLVLAAALPPGAGADEYFVDDQAGSDRANGTAAPWQTLARVARAPLKPGDVVRFRCGGTWGSPRGPRRSSPTRSSGTWRMRTSA